MNRGIYLRTVQTVLPLLAGEGGPGPDQAAEVFVHLLMVSGARKLGLSAWLHVEPEEYCSAPWSLSAGLEARILEALDAVPQEEWRNRPELAGWMYQYMLEDRKKRLFSGFRQGRKAEAGDLPAVTQLFTPEWIARYMTENAIGRLWIRGEHVGLPPARWKYYDSDAARLLGPAGSASVPKPETGAWSILDPACGCGHVLAAAFDVLLELYLEAGHSAGEAVRTILGAQLFGVDIDPLAVRLCRFILYLKGVLADPSLTADAIPMKVFVLDGPFRELGSLLRSGCPDGASEGWKLLERRYDAVITNPPYLGRRHMSPVLADYLDREYPRSRNDLFAAFLERSLDLLRPGGCHAVINQQAWMFLSGYEDLRRRILAESSLVSLLHLGSRAFNDITGEVVQSVCFLLEKLPPEPSTEGMYWRLTGEASPGAKEQAYAERRRELRFAVRQESFADVPGWRIAYSLQPGWSGLFRRLPAVRDFYAVKKGMDTGSNDRYVRYWHEVPENTLSFRPEGSGQPVWFPYAKGGGIRRWYGNHYYVVKWANGGEEIRADAKSNLRNTVYYGRPGITWSTVSTGRPGFRLLEPGFLFDNGGSCLFALDQDRSDHFALLAYLNSGMAEELLRQLNPTLNIQPGDVARLPVDEGLLRHPELSRLGAACTALAKLDWDESEWSWNFRIHPMAALAGKTLLLEEAHRLWTADRESRLQALSDMEAEIDRIVYARFGLEPPQDSSKPEPPPLRRRREDAEGLLTYALGCLTGIYASSPEEPSPASFLFRPDRSGMERLVRWLARTWGGEPSLSANLAWLAGAFSRRKGEPPVTRLARYLQEEWYGGHLKRRNRHPVYARFSSGSRHAYIAYAPVGRLNREIVTLVLKQVEEECKVRRDSGCDGADAGFTFETDDLAELEAYAACLEQFREGHPSEPDGGACARTILQYYSPVLCRSYSHPSIL